MSPFPQLRHSCKRAYEQALKHRKEMEELLRKQREEADQREQERRLKAERDRRNGLLRMARDLRKANDIRALVDEVMRTRGGELSEAEKVVQWATWALDVADCTDPLGRLVFEEDGAAWLVNCEPPVTD